MFFWSRFVDRAQSSRPRSRAAFSFSAWRSPRRPPSRRAGVVEAEAEEAGGGGGGAGGGAGGGGAGAGGGGAGAGGSGGGGAGAGGGGGGGGAGGGGGGFYRPFQSAPYRAQAPADDLTTCAPGQVWDRKHHRCLRRRSGILPDSDLTEYAFALAKADRFQEALDVLDMLDNPEHAARPELSGLRHAQARPHRRGDRLLSQVVALDPDYPQVREYLGEAYVIEGKFDLAKDQLATIGKICGDAIANITASSPRRSPRSHAL